MVRPVPTSYLAGDLIDGAAARLKRSPAIDHWPSGREEDEATTLLGFVLDTEPDDIHEDDEVDARRANRFDGLVRRRAGGEPMAHILGYTEFRGLRMRVRPGAFVPRQSSEFVVEQAISRLRRRPSPVAVDLATGIGPIAMAIAAVVPRSRVYGADISGDAIRQARVIAHELELRNVSFHRGDLYGALPASIRGSVDLVTAHAPYVPREELEDLPLEIRGFEPADTLTDHSDHGLGLLTRIAEEGHDWLRPGGWLLVEVSPDFARRVRGLLVRTGYQMVRSTKGWPEVTRVIEGRAAIRRRAPAAATAGRRGSA
jgi:release factor glutamine methyltransferase